jgi:hypothetical protein
VDIGKLFRDAWGLFVKDVGPLIVGVLIASLVPSVAAVIIAAVTFGASIGGLHVDSQGNVTGVDPLNWVLLGVGSVAILVVVVFLSVPLFVGLLSGVLRRVRENRPMAYGDAFDGFHFFGKSIWAAVLLGIIFTAIVAVPTAAIVGGAVTGSAILAGLGVLISFVAMVAYVYLATCWVYVFPLIVDRGEAVGRALGESRAMAHGSSWWWTFLGLLLLQLAIGAASFVLGLIPLIGAVATIVLYPFVLTYVVAMYCQARGEGRLVDAVLGWPRPSPAGSPAYSAPAAPYGAPPAPPAPPYGYVASAASPRAVEQGQTYAPAPPPLTPQAHPADESGRTAQLEPRSAATLQAAPEPPAQPATPEAPPAPEPPATVPGA